MNRLARERSPYLLQHAQNPVDWYPWGDEAFNAARAGDKPIFLSIGYSTCHWCHVMEHESFENDEVATLLNTHFVSIKVDREERPDVDRVYMSFVQATTGSGGWPMSVWLTPDLKPFYGGTYFPPSTRWGRPGFSEILTEIVRAWREERARVAQSADGLTEQLRGMERAVATTSVPGAEALAQTARQFRASFDTRNGGFGDAPKFPRPSELLFLFREYARTGEADPREMALRSLRAMALGGMRDHIGGGFHRYSVDGAWRVPHFEKMLYDQAQLAMAYVEAAQVTRDPFYADVAEDTLLYVLREMTDATGGFHSAEDADSVPPDDMGAHKAEGAFYLWRAEEVDAVVGKDAAVAKLRFGIEPNGNAPVDPQQEFTGKNLLYVAHSVDDIAAETGQTPADVAEALQRARMAMFAHRLGRPRPHRDDKVLTSWNGLMIGALARMDRVLRGFRPDRLVEGQPFLDGARRAAAFIRDTMWDAKSKTLLRRYRDGHAEIEGFAEDYAFLIRGLIELFQADPDPAWLEWAIALQRRQDELFWDEAEAGWFSTTGRDQSVLLRMKEDYDGAEPTASSVSVLNLMALSHLVPDAAWDARVERTLKLFGTRLEQMGRAVPMMAVALSTHLAGMQQIVVAEGAPSIEPVEEVMALGYLPFAIMFTVDAERRAQLSGLLPFIAAMTPVDGQTAVYICRDFACRQPVTKASELAAQVAARVESR